MLGFVPLPNLQISDRAGKPNAGTILIDYDANGIGWFIDETPLDKSELLEREF